VQVCEHGSRGVATVFRQVAEQTEPDLLIRVSVSQDFEDQSLDLAADNSSALSRAGRRRMSPRLGAAASFGAAAARCRCRQCMVQHVLRLPWLVSPMIPGQHWNQPGNIQQK
jgi:hypothetical protein